MVQFTQSFRDLKLQVEFQLSERSSCTSTKLHQEPWNNGLNTNWSCQPIRLRVNNRLPWQLVPWEFGWRSNLTLTLTLIPLGIQIRCKWGGWMNTSIINLFQYCQYPKYVFGDYFSFFFVLFFLCFLLLPLSFQRWSSGAFSPSDPALWEGRVPLLRWAHQTF